MKRGILISSIVFLSLLIIPLTHAAQYTYIISNSDKWTDVYSSILYANLQGIPNSFLVSTAHGQVLLNEIDKGNFIRVLTSSNNAYVINYPSMIRSQGFAGADEIKSSDMNLDLIKDLPNITNFIVVGDSFGYNALAVTPYALQTNSWVFLANSNNIYQIDSILSQRNVKSLMVYGYVDPSVRTVLAKYNPEVINNGDRFSDNIDIVEKYLKIHPTQQVVLTNGEFIEKEIMGGTEPVLFTGQQNVPTQISNWLKSSNIKVGVLIGNDLVNAASAIRRTTGITVMVKFARNARDQSGGVAPIEGLDLFPVPTPSMYLLLHSVQYNKALSRLDVTYRSDSNIPIYIKGTITINDSNQITRVGDNNPVFIAPGDFKTLGYPTNLTAIQNMTAQVYTLYGESQSGLEEVLNNLTGINVVQVIDSCPLSKDDVKSVNYNKQTGTIYAKIKNPNKVDCWVDGEIQNIKIGYSTQTLGTEGSVMISPGRTKTIEFQQAMTDTDLQSNPYVNLVVYSGEKQDSLVNTISGNYPLGVEMFTLLTYSIAAIVFIIIILVVLFIILRKKRKEYY